MSGEADLLHRVSLKRIETDSLNRVINEGVSGCMLINA